MQPSEVHPTASGADLTPGRGTIFGAVAVRSHLEFAARGATDRFQFSAAVRKPRVFPFAFLPVSQLREIWVGRAWPPACQGLREWTEVQSAQNKPSPPPWIAFSIARLRPWQETGVQGPSLGLSEFGELPWRGSAVGEEAQFRGSLIL